MRSASWSSRSNVAGRAWPAEEVTVNADEFTAEQIEQILAEPMLVVIVVAAE